MRAGRTTSHVAMAAAVLWAAGVRAETLFVQAARLELRAGPSATDPVVAEVAIGAACRVVRKLAHGWARLDCVTGAGHAELAALGRDLPSYMALRAIALDVRRPYAERVVAAEKALALGDAAERDQDNQVMREAVVGAELDALSRHRHARTPAVGSVRVEGCATAQACVLAALHRLPDLDGARDKAAVIVKEADFVAFWLSPEALLRIGAGHTQAEPGGVTQVTLERVGARAFVDPALRALVGPEALAGSCLEEPRGGDDLPLCTMEVAQNCSPNTCSDDEDYCEAAATRGCHKCARLCMVPCRGCRARCAAADAGCLAACLNASRACRTACGAVFQEDLGQCSAEEETCVRRNKKRMTTVCRKACDALETCRFKCVDEHDVDSDAHMSCLEACPRRVPKRCQVCLDMMPF